MSRTDGISEARSPNYAFLSGQTLEADGDEEKDDSSHIVYMASFDELAENFFFVKTPFGFQHLLMSMFFFCCVKTAFRFQPPPSPVR